MPSAPPSRTIDFVTPFGVTIASVDEKRSGVEARLLQQVLGIPNLSDWYAAVEVRSDIVRFRPEFGGWFCVLPGQGVYAKKVFPLHSVFEPVWWLGDGGFVPGAGVDSDGGECPCL